MENLSQYYQIVESAIKGLGIDPATCRGQKPGQWDLKKGSASVWVDIMYIEKESRAYFQVMAPICEVPSAKLEDFYKELLEINYGLYGVSFVKYEKWIYIKMIREADGLDANECSSMLNRVGNYSDHYDDYLKEKYHGTLGNGSSWGK